MLMAWTEPRRLIICQSENRNVKRTEHEDATHVHHPLLVSLLQPQLREHRIGDSEPTSWWATREDIVVRQGFPCTVRDDAMSRVMDDIKCFATDVFHAFWSCSITRQDP